MNTSLINYATHEYREQQQSLTEEAKLCGFDPILEFNRNVIELDYYKEHKLILDQKRGAGSALWKPYILLKAMEVLPPNSYVLYMDCGDKIINYQFKHFIEDKLSMYDYFFVQNIHLNKYHTRRDCFTLMNCDEEHYWNYPILEAGICGFRITDFTIAFVKDWLYWCEQEDVVMDVPNKNIDGKENFPGFTNHKCDQSILTNLVAKWNYKTTPIHEVMRYVSYNYRG